MARRGFGIIFTLLGVAVFVSIDLESAANPRSASNPQIDEASPELAAALVGGLHERGGVGDRAAQRERVL